MTTRHIIPISGKDSLATAIWQTAHEPELPYEFAFNDTRAELPETYEWLARVEKVLGITIIRIGKSLEQVIDEQGILPSPRIRFCTERSKIRPMDRFIGSDNAIVYFGLRADEPERVGAFKTAKLTPRYPLRDAGIGLSVVYRIVEARELMPPAFFWQRLYDAVAKQMGEVMAVVESWPAWMKARVFAWRSRPNCYFCFFQRRYEWVGLLEFHPELFDRAEAIELRVGNGPELRRSTGFQWIAEGYPLSKIRENAEAIFVKRVAAICKLINDARQGDLFQAALDEMDMAGTSCGLLCGK
jgi:hypothetical protein